MFLLPNRSCLLPQAEVSYLTELNQLLGENYALELGYYKNSEYLAEQRKNKLLQYERDVFEYRQELYEKFVFYAQEFNAKILGHIAENVKSISEIYADAINGVFDQAVSGIDKLLDKAGIGKIPILGDIAKGLSSNFLGKLAGGIFDSPGITNPVKTGNPALDEAKKQTDVQKQIEKNTRTASSITNSFNVPNSSQGLGAVENILHELLHGGSSGGGSSSGNLDGLNSSYIIKNLLGIGTNGARTGDVVNDVSQVFAGDKGRGDLWSNIKFAFGNKDGSFFGKNSPIFGADGFGNNVGTYGAIGGASLIGGLIGGRVGGFISGAGSGLALGAQIGSMFAPGIGTAIGAVVGAVGGGLLSLFGGDPKRKRDKNEKIPALHKVFDDSLSQLRALGADKNQFYSDPEGVLVKAMELRAQIAAGGGLQFESKKYQKQAQQEIAAKLVEADAIILDLNNLKDRAVRARDIDTRLQTSFATGVYVRDDQMRDMQSYRRRNGMLEGVWNSKDELPSLLARGEMVLNPSQIRQVISHASADVFKGAGIPGYASGVYVAPTYSAPTSYSVPNSVSASGAVNETKHPIIVNIVLKNSGIVESDIEDVLIEGLDKDRVQTKIVKSYDKGKSRNKTN